MSVSEDTVKLCGARIAIDARRAEPQDIIVQDRRISFAATKAKKSSRIDLSGCLILPGLINAHDHLEFNLFPRLGNGPYPNYIEWARDIYRPRRSPLKEHLAVPKKDRLLWGGLKNLLSGVTTVAHHNEYDRAAFDGAFPVKVVKKYGWAHSLQFSSDLRERFDEIPDQWPFILHAAEGSDAAARAEITRLDELGMLSDHTVLVHGVALREADFDLIRGKQCALAWCPSSNMFTCGQTLSSHALDSGIPIALGTDSALTAQGDMGDEMCAAAKIYPRITDRLYAMVTTIPAAILRLPPGTGTIGDGVSADLVAVADRGQSPSEALPHLFPELVIVAGKIRLISRRLLEQNPSLNSSRFQRIFVHGKGEAFVPFKLDQLYEATSSVLGRGFRLAGREVTL